MSREGAADTKYRMSAYYYSFRPTGVPEIDNILNAIAWAGKAFHRTEHWTEEISPYPECEGESCCDWIQNAADKAAKALDAAYAEGLRDAAKQVPTNWCDELLSGKTVSKLPWNSSNIEQLLRGVQQRIERLAQQAEGGADGTHE